MVDKLWQGMFNKDSKLVVDFIVQLIGQVFIKELSRQSGKINLYFHPDMQNTAACLLFIWFLNIKVYLNGEANKRT